MNRSLYVVMGVIALAVGGYVAWYLASPLFINETVDEAFPTVAEIAEMSADEVAELPEEVQAAAEEELQATAEAMPDAMIEDDMPETAEPTQISQGFILGADEFHQGSGVATIYALADGSHVLRFEEFDVTNGPDLHVLLSKSTNPLADLGDYIDLGELKGNMGNQNYTIPADVDISEYNSIVIYCVPFSVNFAAANLSP